MIVLSALAIAVAIGFALLASARSGWRPRVVWVECLRVVLVSAAVWMLTQPETIYSIDSKEKPGLVLLVDRSQSMQSVDVDAAVSDRAGLSMISRASMVDRLLKDERWSRLEDRFERNVEPFALRQNSRSDLAKAIGKASQEFPNAAAVVLISDGDWSGPVSPVDAVADLRLRSGAEGSGAGQSKTGRAIFSVGVGSEQSLPDVQLASALIPSYATRGKPLRIPVVIQNDMPGTQELSVKLNVRDLDDQSGRGRVVDQERLTIRSGARGSLILEWLAADVGAKVVSAEVQTVVGESDVENNRVEKTIEVREEKLRVLIVESEPRWEFRYLRNALLRDPGVDVSCLLLHPQLSNIGGGGDDYLKEFPSEVAELASYDVIFLGDVGLGVGVVAGDAKSIGSTRAGLSSEQCRQIAGLVQQQAAGLVLMPGPNGRQVSLIESELGRLYPVVLDDARPRGVGNATVGQFSLTSAGRTSLLAELEDDRAANWKRWADLPGFYWHAAVIRPHAGSEVLAVHSETSNEFGRLPLLVTRAVGAGKVLFMGTDSAWRWRRGVEDRYHYRFWGQVIRWMAYQRNMAAGQRLRLSYFPEQPKPGDSVGLRLSVMTDAGAPFDGERFIVSMIESSGQERSIELEQADSEWGVYTGGTELAEPGEYRLVARHPTDGSEVTARLTVQGRAVEQVGRGARLDVMKEIARVGGGEYVGANQLDDLFGKLEDLPDPEGLVERVQWWNHPGVTVAFVMGLALFWMGRKWVGMV